MRPRGRGAESQLMNVIRLRGKTCEALLLTAAVNHDTFLDFL